jgi:hypothetical protein
MFTEVRNKITRVTDVHVPRTFLRRPSSFVVELDVRANRVRVDVRKRDADSSNFVDLVVTSFGATSARSAKLQLELKSSSSSAI